MKVIEINLEKQLTTTFFDPSPHRLDPDEPPVNERRIPLKYSCEKCGNIISFTTHSFEKHCNSRLTNLKDNDHKIFALFISNHNLNALSRLDFYCPTCMQATTILYQCGSSGFWGNFCFDIKKVIVLKNSENI